MATQTAKPLTLSQMAFFMRKFILFGGITVAVLIVGRMFLESAVAFWKATHPEPPPPPTVGFGILPPLDLPKKAASGLTYKLEVPVSRLRPVSDRASVFFIASKRANLLALEKANEQAKVLGFLFEPEKITDDVYRWRRERPLPAYLEYNIISGLFTMTVDWQSDPAFLQDKRLPKEDSAIQTTRSILQQVGLLSKDIATGSAKVTYLRATGTSYTTTVSFSEADFLQIDLFRTPVLGVYPVVTTEPTRGTIRAIITPSPDRAQQIAKLEFNYLPVSYENFHTYPIITPSQAYDLLVQGKGGSSVVPEGLTQAVIRTITLSYYDSGKQQQYFQPIYVLEGDGGYVGYVPAIDPRWTAQ